MDRRMSQKLDDEERARTRYLIYSRKARRICSPTNEKLADFFRGAQDVNTSVPQAGYSTVSARFQAISVRCPRFFRPKRNFPRLPLGNNRCSGQGCPCSMAPVRSQSLLFLSGLSNQAYPC